MPRKGRQGRGSSDFFDEVGENIAEDELQEFEGEEFDSGELYDEQYVYLTGEDIEVDEEPLQGDGELDEDELEEDELEDGNVKGKSKSERIKRTLMVIGLGVLGVLVGIFLLFNALNNRTDVANIGMAETEVLVQNLFGESGNIKRELTRDAVDEAKLYVAQLEEGTGKNQLQMKLSQAEKQLESQIQAQRLVSEVTKDGQPYVDISRSSLPVRVLEFPTSYDPEYSNQLMSVYNTSYDAIESAFNLEDEFNRVVNGVDVTPEIIQQFKVRVEQLPASQLKQRMSREYNKQMEKFQQAHQESIQRAEQERKEEELKAETERREAEELARLEQESIQRAESIAQQNEIERQREEARIQAEIAARLEAERKEQERIESERQSIEESIQESIQESIKESLEAENIANTPPVSNDETV